MKIRFCLECDVRPMPRPRVARNGGVYFSKEILKLKATISAAAQVAMKGRLPLEGALRCSLKFFRKFKPTSRRYGDADNIVKLVTDSLNGICYLDDAQVVQLHAEKNQADAPRVEVEISELAS